MYLIKRGYKYNVLNRNGIVFTTESFNKIFGRIRIKFCVTLKLYLASECALVMPII